jgi:hypothetical protein
LLNKQNANANCIMKLTIKGIAICLLYAVLELSKAVSSESQITK